MAIPGTFQTYDLATGVKLDVEDMIWLLSPYDVPLQGAMGADGRTALGHTDAFEVKVEWLDEALLNPVTTVATAVATTTATSVTVVQGLAFQTGDILLIDGEYLQVSGYSTTTANALIVTRGFNGSTATTFNIGDNVQGVGAALAEGSNPPAARAVDRSDRYNLTQIFGPVAVQVSGTEQVVQKYGLTGTEFDHQVANRTKELYVGIEQALLYGTRQVGSATIGRTLGGFTYYITSNIDSATTQITDATLLAQLQAAFVAGGTPDRIVVGAKQKQTLSGLESANIRYAQDTNVRGQVVDFYDSDYGRLSVILDRWCNKANLFIFAREQATIADLRPVQLEMLAKTGDAVNGQVVCEKTLMFRRQQHAAMFTALT